MRSIAKLNSQDRQELFSATAAKMNISEAIIEKDFWVCFTLDYLFHICKWKNAFALKGGTSLSKAYITVTSGPTKTSYTEGETFDPAGIVITATYGDGTTAPVTGFTFAPSGALKVSDTMVTISYTEGDVTRSATVAITVVRKSDPKPVPTHDDDDREPLFTGTWNNPVKSGAWSQDSHGIWHYTSSEIFRNTWAYIYNPYAHDGQHTSDWFWFDRQGNMLTGWQFINGKWYYLNPTKDGTLGACQLGGVTPDGWTVKENGEWDESIPKK